MHPQSGQSRTAPPHAFAASEPSDIEHARRRRQIDIDTKLCAELTLAPVKALEKIYDAHAALVYGLAYAMLGSRQEAEDLTQEVFVTLNDRCTYDPARGTLAGYLTTLTRSRAIDILRSRNRSSRLLGLWGSDGELQSITALDEADADERARSVRSALAALPGMQRRVIELAYFRGLTQVEIAEILNTPLGTVKTWVRLGLQALRSALQHYVD